MTESTRPKRVVVVDADNPLVEIHGDFYWLEDHDRIVAQTRESAYAQGYADAIAAAAAQRSPHTVVLRYRRSRLRRAVTTVVVGFVVPAFVITLVSDLVGAIHSP